MLSHEKTSKLRSHHTLGSTWLAIVVLFLATSSVWAQMPADDEITPQQMQSGSLLLRMKNGYRVATRMNTTIDATVNGIVARVTVRQTFLNDGSDWVEGIYVFPLPDEAAVDHLRMRIGERFIEGDIREKAQARKEYEQAKTEGKKASLVEQQRANMFTTSVANIAPGETVIIEIEYLETVRYDEGIFSLRFPLTITPRYIPGSPLPDRKGSGWSADTTQVSDASLITPPVVTASKDHKLTFTADINAGVPLEFIASRYHVVDVSNSNDRYHVELGDDTVPLDHDLELNWRPIADGTPRVALFTESIDGDTHALLMMLPPNEMAAPMQRMPREMIFVIDTSGSMHGTSIEQARRALTLAIGGLRPEDRFNVIQFNSMTSALFPSSVTATTTNLDNARRYVNGLAANGGTEMYSAIELALRGAVSESHLRQVVFITDGSVGNEERLYRLIDERLGRSRLFTVGIGSAPNSWFMRKAAEAGRGTFTMIGALHEVNEKMGRLFRKIEQPQVTGITVDWPGAVNVEPYPSTVPDLYAGEPIVVRARLGQAARPGDRVIVRGHSVTGGWQAELTVDDGAPRSGIAALWARGRIEHLLDEQRRGAPEEETRAAVVETALAHHLVSKYTSLVAVDKTPVRPAGEGLTSEQVPNLLPYGQSAEAIFGFPATATPAALYRWQGLAMILAGLLVLLILTAERRRHANGQAT